MSDSNFAELRRVRTEMSVEAGHDFRRFVELLDGVRARYRDRLVNHGADSEQGVVSKPPTPDVWDEELAPTAR